MKNGYYDNHKRRKSWVDRGQPSTSTRKPNIHGKKVLLNIWQDIKDVVHYKLLDPGQTAVTAKYYQQQFIRLSDSLEQKRLYTGSGSRQVILQQDNARPHIAKGTKNVIYTLSWEVLPHAAYSSDLAPSDYHLFRSLHHHLADKHFKTVDEVRKNIDDFIESKPPNFFREGIRQLPERVKSLKIMKIILNIKCVLVFL